MTSSYCTTILHQQERGVTGAATACYVTTGCMVVRFTEDGSKYWFPLVEIQRFLKDMQNKGRDAESDTIGQGSHAFAAQVLAGSLVAKKKASGITSSSATTGALPLACRTHYITVWSQSLVCRCAGVRCHQNVLNVLFMSTLARLFDCPVLC